MHNQLVIPSATDNRCIVVVTSMCDLAAFSENSRNYEENTDQGRGNLCSVLNGHVSLDGRLP
jgi:hypothetical protein